jgi:hypothetical protein
MFFLEIPIYKRSASYKAESVSMRSNTAFHDNKSSILKPISWSIYVMYVQVEVDPFKFLLILSNNQLYGAVTTAPHSYTSRATIICEFYHHL